MRLNIHDTRALGKRKVDKKFVLRHLFGYLKPHVLILVGVFLLSVLGTVSSLVGPWLCGLAIDEIDPVGGTNFSRIGMFAGCLIALYLVSALLEYLSAIGMAYISRRIVKKMRVDVFSHLATLPVDFFEVRQAGDIISVLSYDIDTVGESLANDVMIVLKSAVMIVGSLVMMLLIAPLLVSVFAFTVPLSVFLTRFIVRRVQPLFRRRSQKLGELNGFVEEMTAGQKTTRAYHCEDKIIADFEVKNDEAIKAYARAEYLGTISGPCVNFVNNLSLTLISVCGALLYMHPILGIEMTAGGISSFVLYSRKFSGPINEIANIMGEFQSAIAAAERVFRVLEEPSEPKDAEDAETLENVQGNVEISHLGFGYIKDQTVLKDFSLSAKKGQVVAIVGHTGAGKTTIINLLMRFYDPQRGKITIDGKDILHLTRSSVRGAFTMVLQDTWLFAGSVYENIAYGNGDVSREEVEAVCKAAKIHSFIEKLPQGYDTVLTDNAVNISKGQRQLLSIARAMLKDSPMLILDEATSNVDTRTEQIIQDAMTSLMKGKTCFIIAHRLSTIQNADLIVVMREGDVIEQGTHESLLKKQGYYAKLYGSQFESF